MELITLALVGLFAGLVGGLLGVGGSVVMIPALTELLGPDQHLYQSTAMIVNFFVVVPAVYQHRRARAIDGDTVLRILPLGVVSVVVGVGVSELPVFAAGGEAYLRALFGLFLLFVAGYDLYRLFRRRTPGLPGEDARPSWLTSKPWRLAAAVGVPTGLVAGMLGVGGGMLAVPLQRRLLRIPIRIAIANSATIIIATSLIGAAAKNWAYAVDHPDRWRPLGLAVVLIPTAILGSMNGSKMTHRLPLRTVKVAFFILLMVVAVRLTYRATRDFSDPPPDAQAQRPASVQRWPISTTHLPSKWLAGSSDFCGCTGGTSG